MAHIEQHKQPHQQQDSDLDQFALSADPSKYVTLPVQNDKIWCKYQTSLDWFWTAHDVYLADDKVNMSKTFDEQQRDYILRILAFMFTAHTTIINKELFMELINQVDIKEAAYYFGSQADSKKTHSIMYSMLLDELLDNDTDKKNKLIAEVASMPQVRNTLRWCLENLSSDKQSFSKRLLTLASLQGILFPAAFVLFSWLHNSFPKRENLAGLNTSNSLIWRDEKLNLSFSCMLFEYIEDELEHEEAIEIIKQAVATTKSLFTNALPVSKLGMDCDLMSQFIEHSADKILSDIRIRTLYNVESPFDWVVEPDMEPKNAQVVCNAATTTTNFGDTNFETDGDF